MDRSLAIGGVLYEIISPSVRNVSLAQEYLKELPEEKDVYKRQSVLTPR